MNVVNRSVGIDIDEEVEEGLVIGKQHGRYYRNRDKGGVPRSEDAFFLILSLDITRR